jgi:hypothetical protein
MWLIIRKPTVSMPSSRAYSMCCLETSASVQWVAIRTDAGTPASVGRLEVVHGADAGQQQGGAPWRG